jgi:hypothetical protein
MHCRFSAITKEGRDAASRARSRPAPMRRRARHAPRPAIGFHRLRGGRSFTPGWRSAGGVRGSGSTRTVPVRLPAVVAPRASALVRYGHGVRLGCGGRPRVFASPRRLPRGRSLGKHQRSRSIASLVASGSNLARPTGLRAERRGDYTPMRARSNWRARILLLWKRKRWFCGVPLLWSACVSSGLSRVNPRIWSAPVVWNSPLGPPASSPAVARFSLTGACKSKLAAGEGAGGPGARSNLQPSRPARVHSGGAIAYMCAHDLATSPRPHTNVTRFGASDEARLDPG